MANDVDDDVPEEILAQFRASALERLPRAESAWLALTHGTRDAGLVAELGRDVHTLKGDAGVVGYDTVRALCEKLEDILAFARKRNYRVPDEVGLIATMAFQFIGLILRKKDRSKLAGVDVPGFVAQVEQTLREASLPPPDDSPPSVNASIILMSTLPEANDRLSLTTRRKLGAAATSVFLEYLQTVGPARERLHQTWQAMSGELTRLEASPLMPVVAKQVGNAKQLAESLGKQVDISLSLSGVLVAADVAAALDVAVLHALRNAVDHGIEPPDERAAKGKPSPARISISGQMTPETVTVSVEDDGRGIDVDQVRARAVERRVLDGETARRTSNAELLDLLFLSGFSTRKETTSVSGRGVGLDAVKNALRRVEGSVSLSNSPGRGLKVTFYMAQSIGYVGVTTFTSARGGVTLALPSTWTVRAVTPGAGEAPPPELLALLNINARKEPPPPIVPTVLELTSAGKRYRILAGSRPSAAVAERICVTDMSEPVEVVSVRGTEALLVRPDRVPGLAR
jgi:two-component system chemotaxis sensor kinase CheA